MSNYPPEVIAIYTVIVNGAISLATIAINYLLNFRHKRSEIRGKDLDSAKTAMEISQMSQERQLQLEKEIADLRLQLENCDSKDAEIESLNSKIADLQSQLVELEVCKERIKIIEEHEKTIESLKLRLSKRIQLVQEFSLDNPSNVSSKVLEVKAEKV